MKYKIETKSGKIYKARDVELAYGFLTMKFWNGELRLPAGEISSIKKTYLASANIPEEKSQESSSGGLAVPVFLFILVFVFSLPLLISVGT